MITEREQKKNILLGYFYIAGGIAFIIIMAVIFATDQIATDTREYVVMAITAMIGIACMYTGIKQIRDNKMLLGGLPKSVVAGMMTEMALFKTLDISVREVTRHMTPDKERYFTDNPVIVYRDDVVEALEKYKAGKVSGKELLVWCQMITFSRCYSFNADRYDEIESVINLIKKRLAKEEDLSEEEINELISALEQNAEI